MEHPVDIEIENIGQEAEPRVKRSLHVGLYALAALILASSVGYFFFTMHAIETNVADDESRFHAARAEVTEAVLQLPNIETRHVAEGFWYTYRDVDQNEHILWFDADQVARLNLADAELENLLSVIEDSEIVEKPVMRARGENELDPQLQFHNGIYSYGTMGASLLEQKQRLQKRTQEGRATSEDLFHLSYIYELEGKYAERDKLNAQNCEMYGVRCDDELIIEVTGRVVDQRGQPIAGAAVEVASQADGPSDISNMDGIFRLSIPVKAMEKLRIRAEKSNFSIGYGDALVLTDGKREYRVGDIRLESPISVITANLDERTVTGEGNRFLSDGTLIITTSQSTYTIPPRAIVREDGTPARGTIDMYLFEFTKANPPENFMHTDTFDEVLGYAGDLMKTFGMPFIQFYDADGTKLHVLKSNPMRLRYTIPDMEALYNNVDGIYRPLTQQDMDLLVAASIGQPYRIDRAFLIEHDMLHFPAFWVFDQKRGVWDNVGMTVLNPQGTIEMQFYTIRDDL